MTAGLYVKYVRFLYVKYVKYVRFLRQNRHSLQLSLTATYGYVYTPIESVIYEQLYPKLLILNSRVIVFCDK